MIKTKVCVVGAGPAGAFASLFLSKHEVEHVLVDQAKFPRDKICGDGVSGWVLTILNELDPDILLRLNAKDFVLHSHGIRISSPNRKTLDLPFMHDKSMPPGVPAGYTARRIDLDNFLVEEVRKSKYVNFREETEIEKYSANFKGVKLTTKSGESIESQIVIFANGANSAFMKDPGNIHKSKKGMMTGIKCYYEGVTGFHDGNYVELHFLNEILPGYFWLFQVPGGLTNVGVGLDRERIGKKRINLTKLMNEAISNVPDIKARFANAMQVTKVQSYGLPLWEGRVPISGDRFMLAGDAASLIDPVTGEGMGHAAITGNYAAEQAVKALKANDFSKEMLNAYDDMVYKRIGNELQISSKIARFIQMPWLFNLVVNRATNSKVLQEKLKMAMTDLDARQELHSPWLYLKVLLGM